MIRANGAVCFSVRGEPVEPPTRRMLRREFCNELANQNISKRRTILLFVSILTSDRSHDPELWATIRQGEPPPSLELISAYNLGNDKRVFIWNGESLADT